MWAMWRGGVAKFCVCFYSPIHAFNGGLGNSAELLIWCNTRGLSLREGPGVGLVLIACFGALSSGRLHQGGGRGICGIEGVEAPRCSVWRDAGPVSLTLITNGSLITALCCRKVRQRCSGTRRSLAPTAFCVTRRRRS